MLLHSSDSATLSASKLHALKIQQRRGTSDICTRHKSRNELEAEPQLCLPVKSCTRPTDRPEQTVPAPKRTMHTGRPCLAIRDVTHHKLSKQGPASVGNGRTSPCAQIQANDPAPRPTGRMDCNHSAMAGYA